MRDRAAADIGGTERPALGVGLMVAAMLAIPVVDATAKHLAADYSPLFISWARYAVASVLIVRSALSVSARPFSPAMTLARTR